MIAKIIKHGVLRIAFFGFSTVITSAAHAIQKPPACVEEGDRCGSVFEYYCRQKSKLEPSMIESIDALLYLMRTYNCREASGKLLKTEFLEIRRRGFTDLKLLVGMKGLQTLFLNGTSVNDVSYLSGLPQLQFLSLIETPISDVTSLTLLLQSLPELRSLWLLNTKVPLQDLIVLKRTFPQVRIIF